MDGPSENGLAEFAEAIRRARPRGLVDLYLEAVSEAWWRLDHGTVVRAAPRGQRPGAGRCSRAASTARCSPR
jgi:hypothetical protein